MDAKDCEDTDKAMGRKINAIYADPARHAFYSSFQFDEDNNTQGPRGGKIRGSKSICYQCGKSNAGHADKDEPL